MALLAWGAPLEGQQQRREHREGGQMRLCLILPFSSVIHFSPSAPFLFGAFFTLD